MRTMKKAVAIGIVAFTAAAWQSAAVAQTTAAYPSKPVKVIVGFPPASGADIMARIISQRVGDALGQIGRAHV